VVAVAYAMGARAPESHRPLIVFSVVVKVVATVFLVLYWLAHPQLWSVLASGIVDGLMAVLILLPLRTMPATASEGSS